MGEMCPFWLKQKVCERGEQVILPVGSTPHSEDQHLLTAYLLYGEALYWVQRDAEVCRTILLSSGLCIVQRWKYYSDLKKKKKSSIYAPSGCHSSDKADT